ncbi:hypothetical protein [Methanosphaera sp.]
MIIACSLLTGDTTIILPILLFIGIITGIMKKNPLNESILTALIAFVIGSIIAFIISLITIYYTYGGLYAIAVMQYSLFSIILYTIVGCIGDVIGYYIFTELKYNKE